MQVTVIDTQSHPIRGASFDAFDADHHPLEDPDEVAHASGYNGQVSYNIPASSVYYVRAYSKGYLPHEIKLTPVLGVVSATVMLKRAPLPSYPVTVIRAIIMDGHKHPIKGAFFDVFSAAGRDLENLSGTNDLTADPHGRVEKKVRAGGVLHIRVQAYGYNDEEKKVRPVPGVTSLVFVLRRNGGPLSMLKDVSP